MIKFLLDILLMHPLSLSAGIAIGYLLPGSVSKMISFLRSLLPSFKQRASNVINIKDKL